MPGFSSPNYTQAPNDWFDEMLPLMSAAEMKVTAVLIRHTFGFHKRRVELSLSALSRKTGLSESSVIRGATAAEERGIIRAVNKGGGRRRRLVWEVVTGPPATSTVEVAGEVTTSTVEVALPLQQRQTTSTVEGRIKKTKTNKKNTLTTAAAINTSAAAAAAVEHGEWWSLPVLIAAGKLPKEHSQAVAAAAPSPGAFVSKYLFALAKRGFNKPGLWAARQVATNPGAWEGEPYESLASLGPAGVAGVLAWLRDDGQSGPPLNGAAALALAMRADLKDKYSKEPARAFMAAADAINDLGLAALVVPAAEAEAELAEPARPAAAPIGEWEELLQTWRANGLINYASFDRLSRCRLKRNEGGRLFVSVPSALELEYIQRRLENLTRVVSVEFSLREDER